MGHAVTGNEDRNMRIVICGAGTAGCILAARLSEQGHEVVLLEAGPHYAPGSWPAALSHAYRVIRETHDWGFFAQAGASPRLVHVPRGRVVGGSSVTNGAIALRGLPEHYDDWDAFVDGFSWETWLPWFCRIESDGQFGAEPWHGDAGPIPINRHPRETWYPLMERFAEACRSRGHAWVDDHNRPGAVGVGPVPFNMQDGVRVVPADTHLAPALASGRVRLVCGVTVDRVVCERGRATAVEAVDEAGERIREEADHVIVSLGTYVSPAVLLRSGIGPAAEIARHGIDLVADLPGVGQAMMDHPKISYRFWVEGDLPTWPHPWIQALVTAFAETSAERRLFQVMPYVGTTEAGHRFTDFNVQVADARSRRGSVTISGCDPNAQPVLRMGWLEDDGDREVAVQAGRELMAIARTRPLAGMLTPWPNQDDPDHVLRTTETFHHPVATCRMGRPDDPDAVVDARGQLREVAGLSVIDASIIPRVPSANTHLCVIALAERLAAEWAPQVRSN